MHKIKSLKRDTLPHAEPTSVLHVCIHVKVCLYICRLMHLSLYDPQPQQTGSPAAASWERGELAGGGCYGNGGRDGMLISVGAVDRHAVSREVVEKGRRESV